MRLDLAADLRARIGAPDKDARLTNAFVEVKAGPVAKNSAYPAKKETCVRKRPGCATTGYDYTTPIQGAGGSLPYLIYDDTFSAFDEAPAGAVAIGDLVGGYYAMVDDPPTSPGPGDDFWSASAPDSRRYKAWDYYWVYNANWVYADVVAGNITQASYWIMSGLTPGPGKTAASYKAAAKSRAWMWPNSYPGAFRQFHYFGHPELEYLYERHLWIDPSPPAINDGTSIDSGVDLGGHRMNKDRYYAWSLEDSGHYDESFLVYRTE